MYGMRESKKSLHFIRQRLLLLQLQRITLMQLLLAALEPSALVLLHEAMAGAEVALAVLAVAHAAQREAIALAEGAPSPSLGRSHFECAALGREY